MKKNFKKIAAIIGVITGIAAVLAPAIVLLRRLKERKSGADSE